jgi:hypothetical protein
MPQKFRHYKRTDHTYEVVGHFINEADLKPMTAYRCDQTGVGFLRPVEDFYGLVELESGELVRRFIPLGVDGTAH